MAVDLQYISDGLGKMTGVLIPITDWTYLVNKYSDLADEIEYISPEKRKILDGIKDAFEEIKLIKEGKKKPNSFKDLLDEL